LARAKAQIIANQTFEKDSYMNQANEIGSLEAVNLSWKDADNYVKRVNEVSAQQIQDVARKYLISDRLTIGNLRPLPLKSNQVDQPIVTRGGQNVR
jgi:zinc protease